MPHYRMALTSLLIDEIVLIGVHEFRTLAVCPNVRFNNKQCPVPATHEIVGNTKENLRYSGGIDVPDADTGTLVYLRGGALLGRGPTIRCLVYGDNLYFMLTWHDVIGRSIPGGRELCRSEKGRKVNYLKLAAKEQYELVMAACAKSGIGFTHGKISRR